MGVGWYHSAIFGFRKAILAVAIAAAATGTLASPARASGTASTDAYQGAGTWIDIFDARLLADPVATVEGLSLNGVRTIYVETANYTNPRFGSIAYPIGIAGLIDAAHASGIKVVAWYLPGFVNRRRDLRRSLDAIRFTTLAGNRFDSFALDIEASLVRSIALRNKRLLSLSAAIRQAVGPTYPLGAIIPSPRGMQLVKGYWENFPYADLGLTYDVFLPMGYFSYRPTDLGGAYGYTVRNISLIRRGTGNPQIAIHAIGGVGDDVSAGQVNAFVRATRDCGIPGASLYDFTTTAAGGWKYLRTVRTRAGTSKSSCL
jgi:hypothetical protein